MKSLISIIIPVYNVCEYLEKCLDSVINQTYNNLEIILVDDGSSDGSEKICDEYAMKDKRVKVIHKENGGVASARNEGVKHSAGAYIGWIDSDDFACSNMFERLYELAQENDADIVICDNYINEINEDGSKLEVYTMKAKDIMPDVLLDKITSHLWNKLFKRELFNDILFPDISVAEDVAVMHKIFEKANNVTFTKEKLYLYFRRRSNNLTNNYKLMAENRICRAEQFIERSVYADDKGLKDVSDELFAKGIHFYISGYLYQLISSDDYDCRTDKEEIRSILNRFNKNLSGNIYISKTDKVLALLILYNINILLKLAAKRLK